MVSYAQNNAGNPAYEKYKDLPAFNILMPDSSTIFNTGMIKEGRYSILMFFSPDCDHCHAATDSLLRHMDVLKSVQICMFSPATLSAISEFYNKKELKKYKNILAGKDYDMFFVKFFHISSLPAVVVYDKKKKFLNMYQGTIHMDNFLSNFK